MESGAKKNEKDEGMKKAYGERLWIMPLGVVEDSKMSGEEPPLKVHKHSRQNQKRSALKSH